MHAPSTPSTPSWKSVFRLPSSSKKYRTNANNNTTLAVDCSARTVSSPHHTVRHHQTMPSPSLTPGSFHPIDERSSYNSSNTQSSDSNVGAATNSSYLVPDSRLFSFQYRQHLQQSPTSNVEANGIAAPQHPQSRAGPKSEKQRMMLGHAPQTPTKVHTAAASQQSFALSSGQPASSSRSGALSPRAMGASATRFIRRVASAPNAKHLFSSGSRSSAPTRNGLLAPADIVPPVPGASSTSSDLGADSLETLSSGSSRGRGNRHDRYAGNAHLSKSRIVNGAHDGPGKMAFRRTYSSNSIKVRQVSYKALSSNIVFE
jgi:protein-serine/threonine kinase